jgi:hypothetical protein
MPNCFIPLQGTCYKSLNWEQVSHLGHFLKLDVWRQCQMKHEGSREVSPKPSLALDITWLEFISLTPSSHQQGKVSWCWQPQPKIHASDSHSPLDPVATVSILWIDAWSFQCPNSKRTGPTQVSQFWASVCRTGLYISPLPLGNRQAFPGGGGLLGLQQTWGHHKLAALTAVALLG